MALQIKSLVTQHVHVQSLLDKVFALKPAQDSAAIADLLGQLGREMLAHLAIEDRDLYPALRQVGDQAGAPVGLKVQIKNFFDEMEGIKPVVLAFLGKWTAPAIAASPAEFQREFEDIAEALAQRIAREESRLYPLYTEHVGVPV